VCCFSSRFDMWLNVHYLGHSGWMFQRRSPVCICRHTSHQPPSPFSKYWNFIIAVSPLKIWLFKSQYLMITFLYAAIRLVISENCFYFVRPKRRWSTDQNFVKSITAHSRTENWRIMIVGRGRFSAHYHCCRRSFTPKQSRPDRSMYYCTQ